MAKTPRRKTIKSSKNGVAGRNKKPKVAFRRVPIDFEVPDDQAAVFANSFLVQHDDQEFHLLFCQTNLPLVLEGNPESQKNFKELKSIKSRCVVRIVVSAGRIPSIIKALAQNFSRYEAKAAGTVEEIDMDQISSASAQDQ